MKIKNIKIQKLFDIEGNNYDLDFYTKENLTLLYGYNGLGKTSIIKLIEAIVYCNFEILIEFLFDTVEITFDDSSKLVVKEDSESKYYSTDFGIHDKYPITYEEIGPGLYKKKYKFTKSKIRLPGGKFSHYLDEKSQKNILNLKKKLQAKIDLHLIFANRDYNRSTIFEKKIEKINFTPEINDLPLSYNYTDALRLYRDLGEQLSIIEENYPNLINKNGIIPNEKIPNDKINISIHLPDKITEIKEQIINCTDTKKIDLFEEIINNDFGLLYRTVRYSKIDGFSLINKSGINDVIKPEQLSSGEKNIISIFSELIFKSSENSVFFIDEPETSLHLRWQMKFSESILKVCRKVNVQVIITTHSPDILGDYQYLTNEIVSERIVNGQC